jgi:hypothetical protein
VAEPKPTKVAAAQNLLEPSPSFEMQPASSILLQTEKIVKSTSPTVQDLIQKQASVFQSASPEASLAPTSAAASSGVVSGKHLWEYFLSYQALGVLVILLTGAYAFASRESLKQSFSVSYFEYDYGRVDP